MEIMINGLKVNYQVEGNGQSILLLHGWRGCIDSWYPVTQYLKSKYKVYVLDLPGFGKSETPMPPFDYYSYGDLIGSFIKQLKIDKPIIIGHSFGGSIAAGIAARYPELVRKIVLVDSSGIRIKDLRFFTINIASEMGKNLFRLPIISQFYPGIRNLFYKIIGEEDYLMAGKLKATLTAVVRQDIKHLLININCPTLLLWGKNDRATPLWYAHEFKRLINNSRLIIIPNTGHFSYLENPERFCEEVEKFINYE